MVRTLLEAGADAHVRDNYDRTALERARKAVEFYSKPLEMMIKGKMVKGPPLEGSKERERALESLEGIFKEYGAEKTSRLIQLKPGERLDEYLQSYDYVIASLEMGAMSGAAEHAGNLDILKSDFTIADVSPETIISFYAVNHTFFYKIYNRFMDVKHSRLR